MSLPRLRLENCVRSEDGLWTIDAESAKHLVKVRRCYSGSLVEGLLDGEKIELKLKCDGEVVTARELSRESEPEPDVKVTLLLGVLKADQFDDALRFAAETGVCRLILLDCERSVPRFAGANLDGKMKRWLKILDEATKQAGSARPPMLEAPVAPDRLDMASLPKERYAAVISANSTPLKNIKFGKSIALAIGPEGDWSPRETALLAENGFEAISLGRRILRASTAVAAACSWFAIAGEEIEEGE